MALLNRPATAAIGERARLVFMQAMCCCEDSGSCLYCPAVAILTNCVNRDLFLNTVAGWFAWMPHSKVHSLNLREREPEREDN